MEKIYVLSFKWTEEGAWDENDEQHIDIIAVSSDKQLLIEKLYEWCKERFGENADDIGEWVGDKHDYFVCYIGELGTCSFSIEEVDLLK